MHYKNKNIKLNQLINIQQCPYKAYISQLNLNTVNNKYKMINNTYKKILQNNKIWNKSKTALKQVILNNIDDKYFLTTQEKETEVNTIFLNLSRYFTYENKNNRLPIKHNIYGNININNINISVKADVVFKNSNDVEIIKYISSATTLSYKARTEKNKPENNIELYLLKKLGEQLYPNCNVISSFYHMKGKNDKTEHINLLINPHINNAEQILLEDIKLYEQHLQIEENKKEKTKLKRKIKEIKDTLYYDHTKGNNIIQFNINKDLTNNIIELLNTPLSSKSTKCCTNDCEMCNYKNLCNYKYNENKLEKVNTTQHIPSDSTSLNLTDTQKHLIYDTEKGIYRVDAVPGSGKSFSMVLRVIELIKKGYKPEDILLITFTNKACQELKERITKYLKLYKLNINPNNFHIFTFNSFGEYIISKEYKKLGFTNPPELATTIQIVDIIKKLLNQNEYSNIEGLNYKIPLANFPYYKGAIIQIINWFDKIKAYNYDRYNFALSVLSKEKNITDIGKTSSLIFNMYFDFNEILKENNLLQYQDQILYIIEFLKQYQDFKELIPIINKYKYQHIIIDEFQDTDYSQLELIKLLTNYNKLKSLVVVGDIDQSIYSFKNTTPKIMLDFDKDFPNVQDINLLENFRSTPEICNLANNFIKLNKIRINKIIKTNNPNGLTPQLIENDTLKNEQQYIINLIQNKLKQGVKPYEIAYITRTKKELLELSQLLNGHNIPNVIEASEIYLNNSNVQTIINLSYFFQDTKKDYYLLELLNAYKQLGIKDITEKNILDKLEEYKNKIIEVLTEAKQEHNNDENKNAEKDKLYELSLIFYFLDFINPVAGKDTIADNFIAKIISNKQIHTFNQFLTYLQKHVLYNDNTSIEKDEEKYNAIVLTTAHSSKGKEWKIVINSLNKYNYDNTNIDALEEERRLLFVSMTRTKKELYITYNTNQNKKRGKGKYSVFVNELKDNGVEFINNFN